MPPRLVQEKAKASLETLPPFLHQADLFEGRSSLCIELSPSDPLVLRPRSVPLLLAANRPPLMAQDLQSPKFCTPFSAASHHYEIRSPQ